MTFRHLHNARGFFSDYYLGSVFGRGGGRGRRRRVSDRETAFALARFQRIHASAEGRAAGAAECRERFIRPLLRDVLGFHLGAGENRVHALFASAAAEAAGERPLLACYCGAWDEDLEAGRGAARPARSVETALARLELRYGVLVTGERLRLVRAADDGPRGAYLEADLAGLAEEEDVDSFAAFLNLLSAASFLPDAAGNIAIEEIERESRLHAEKVSDDLKQAVFASAEALVAGLIEDAATRGRIRSALDLPESELRSYRDAALLGLYRILFILYAEARDTRLDEHRLYRDSYSAQGLVDEILRDPARAWPRNRCTLWERLRALFRIYDEGLPPIAPWQNIPPRGGDFFSAKTDAGRLLDEARLPDHEVARLVLDLATTAPRRGVGRERVSFRELDIENLGAVYEGILEYEPRVARELLLEIHVQGRGFALPPAEIARLCGQKGLALRGDSALVAGTCAATLHPDAAEADDGDDDGRAEDEDETGEDDDENDGGDSEDRGIRKGAAARLLRRLEPGTFHFVPGAGRKGSGSFYTPRALVQDLVRHALGPLVAGKTAVEIERLRVLDPACGSAHFLVEAMRFLGQALHRAYAEESGSRGPAEFRATTAQGWDADWRASDEKARAANSEARAWCKRRIAERCLFGVDLNPTAVQLARVALWIESVAGDRPLTYFEHHVRCGNSLVGSWLERLAAPPLPTLERRGRAAAAPPSEPGLFLAAVQRAIAAAAADRRTIDAGRSADLWQEGVDPDSLREQEAKEHLRRRAEATLAAAKLLFDLRSAAVFVPEIWNDRDRLWSLVDDPERLRGEAQARPWWSAFAKTRDRERFFHWELEFPEVLLDPERPGFDAVLGNPPWDKIKPDRKEFYSRHDILIRTFAGGELDRRIADLHVQHAGLADEFKEYENLIRARAACLKKGGDYRYQDWQVAGKSTAGDPDLFKFFFERAWRLAAAGGRVGFVVPSALYNNEGCAGLRHLLLEQNVIERFYGFENRWKIFPIDSRYKFVSLVFRKSPPEGDGFEAAFMRHDLAELASGPGAAAAERRAAGHGRAPWLVTVRRSELERLSPGTLAFLEYRSPRDREILLKMYGYDEQGNPVRPRPLLGDQGLGTWNARFYTEYHMTNDRDLWTDPRTGKLWNPRQILGARPGTKERPPYYDPAAWPEIRAAMAEKGFWPLYQDAHIHQFTDTFKPFMRWLSLEQHQRKYHREPDAGEKLVLRDRARCTDERSIIAAVLPPASTFGHTLNGVALEGDLRAFCWLLNSIAFDFLARFRIGGQHASPYLLRPIPVLEADALRGLGTAFLHNAACRESTPYDDAAGPFEKLADKNRALAQAYGLGPDDLEHILSTFPVFIRKRASFCAYLRRRIAEWREEIGGEPGAWRYPEAPDLSGLCAADRPNRRGRPGSGRSRG